MKRHGLHSMYVVQYELASDLRKGLPHPPTSSVASLNTHDMPPFTAFWQGLDIEDRLRLSLLDRPGAKGAKKNLRDMKDTLLWFLQGKGWLHQSKEDTLAVLKACLLFLAASPAQLLLINLEDLWQETQPQNVPSTKTEHPNWQRKARYSLEQFCQLPKATDTLQSINKLRKRAKHR